MAQFKNVNYEFVNACITGNVKKAQFLYDNKYICWKAIENKKVMILRKIITCGHLKILSWLNKIQCIVITRDDIVPYINLTLQRKKWIMFQTLVKKYKVKLDELSIDDLLISVCHTGNLEILKFIFGYFHMSNKINNKLYLCQYAASNEYYDIIKYLMKNMRFTINEYKYMENYILHKCPCTESQKEIQKEIQDLINECSDNIIKLFEYNLCIVYSFWSFLWSFIGWCMAYLELCGCFVIVPCGLSILMVIDVYKYCTSAYKPVSNECYKFVRGMTYTLAQDILTGTVTLLIYWKLICSFTHNYESLFSHHINIFITLSIFALIAKVKVRLENEYQKICISNN